MFWTSSRGPSTHPAEIGPWVEAVHRESAPHANAGPSRAHLHAAGQVAARASSHSSLDRNFVLQVYAPFLVDPYGRNPADCSSALQSSRSVLPASTLGPLAPSAPEDRPPQNHRTLPCGRQLSDPLWKDEEGLEVALEVARTGDSFPGMAGEGHSHHRSRSPCPSQLASVSGRDEEAPG